LKVLLVEDHALPVLAAELVSRAGSANNQPGKSGLATLTATIIGDGTASREVKKLSSDEERIGTEITATAGMDSAQISMSLLTWHADEGMNLLADIAQHPAFRSDDVERDRKQRLISIAQQSDNVGSMALRVGPKLVFGDSPYGLTASGTQDSITAITPADINSFYADHYGPQDSALVLAGDLTRAQAEKLARQYFGQWTAHSVTPAAIPAPPAPQPTHVVIIDKPGAPQTALFAFGLGVPQGSPDEEALSLMNYSLGGSFASRINMDLREEHGYTYGASSRFMEYGDGGEFYAGALVRTDVTAPAAKDLMAQITKFHESPSTADELAAAKEASMRSLPGRFQSTFAIAGAMNDIFLYNRPLDYYAQLPAKYEAIGQDDVARVAHQYLHPDQLVIVAAGDRAKIEPALKDAGLGPVELRDIEGKLVAEPK
jgi:zinc protease